MRMNKQTVLTRDVAAAEIPSGIPITLKTGDAVAITQSLGGSYTVLTGTGYMARVDGKDADALGEEMAVRDPNADAGKTTQELAWDQLKTCFDPEIPVNIVDLGLVYKCEVTPMPEGEGEKAEVRFTLTAPGCGMGDVLREDVKGKLLAVPGIKEADVQVIFDPPWSMGMMSEAAKLQMGIL